MFEAWMLRRAVQDRDVDATLTRLGNLIEDRLAELSAAASRSGAAAAAQAQALLGDLEDLLLVARQAASLQPDGTRQPLQRCEVGG